MAFDLPRLNGDDLRPIEARRDARVRLLAKRRSDGILFSEALAEGAVVFAKACELGLEGIVSKRQGGFYNRGKSPQLAQDDQPEFCEDVT